MPISAQHVGQLVEAEINRVSQLDLVTRLRELLVQIRCEQREWDYGEPRLTYPCWIVAEDAASNTAIAYCEHGFGPSYPWGLLFIRGTYMSMGMDSGWYTSLEDAIRDSMAWDGVNPPDYEMR